MSRFDFPNLQDLENYKWRRLRSRVLLLCLYKSAEHVVDPALITFAFFPEKAQYIFVQTNRNALFILCQRFPAQISPHCLLKPLSIQRCGAASRSSSMAFSISSSVRASTLFPSVRSSRCSSSSAVYRTTFSFCFFILFALLRAARAEIIRYALPRMV